MLRNNWVPEYQCEIKVLPGIFVPRIPDQVKGDLPHGYVVPRIPYEHKGIDLSQGTLVPRIPRMISKEFYPEEIVSQSPH